MEDWTDKILSKVRIERLIGRGGMADVYLGRHMTLERPMAIKILHAHMTEDPDLNRRFKEEAQAVAAMRHPNIVQVVDFDVHEDRPYIVMELLQGMSLSSYLRGLHSMGHSLSFDTISRLISGIASALDYAHHRGIVHRDVKPANIVLRKGETPLRPEIPLGVDVQPILTDFGVARIATSTTRTASGTVLGTPAYMSPEQVLGEVVDARSDIYALGIILYEMLAGKLPFDPDTDTPASILYKHVHEIPPTLANLPANIQGVVDQALAKDKQARYQRAGEMAAELNRAVSSPDPVTVARPSQMAEPAAKQPPVTPEPTAASRSSEPAVPSQADVTTGSSPTIARSSGLSGTALVGAFGLGAAVLAGGVFLGVTILRGMLGPSEPAATLEPTKAPVAAPPTEVAEVEATESGVSTSPTPIPPIDTTTPRGAVLIRDASLNATIQEVPTADAGMAYHAWAAGAEVIAPLHLNAQGEVLWTDGRLTIEYAPPDQDTILGTYDTLLITLDVEDATLLDPQRVVYRAEMDAATAARLRLAHEFHRGEVLLPNLPNWLVAQSVHFTSHVGFALDSLSADDLSGGQLHSEHTINIVEGTDSELYGDWDSNGATQNPSGDDVGLLNYLYLLRSGAEGFSSAQELAGRVDDLPDRISGDATALIDRVMDVRDAARQIAGSDELAVVRELGLEAQMADAQNIRAAIEALVADVGVLDLTIGLQVFAFDPSSG